MRGALVASGSSAVEALRTCRSRRSPWSIHHGSRTRSTSWVPGISATCGSMCRCPGRPASQPIRDACAPSTSSTGSPEPRRRGRRRVHQRERPARRPSHRGAGTRDRSARPTGESGLAVVHPSPERRGRSPATGGSSGHLRGITPGMSHARSTTRRLGSIALAQTQRGNIVGFGQTSGRMTSNCSRHPLDEVRHERVQFGRDLFLRRHQFGERAANGTKRTGKLSQQCAVATPGHPSAHRLDDEPVSRSIAPGTVVPQRHMTRTWTPETTGASRLLLCPPADRRR